MPEFPPTMTQPAAAALSPEQVLSMTAAPAAEATARYHQNMVDLTRSQLQAQMELGMQRSLLAQRLAGEKDIAQWHEKAAQIRADALDKAWDARAKEAEARGQAVADRMADSDLERQNRDIIAKITSLHGKIPDFTSNDTPQTKYSKLTGALQSAIDSHNTADANTILKLHTQLDTIDQEHQAAAKNYANLNASRTMYQLLSQSPNPQDQQAMQTLNDMQAGKWTNPQTGKKMPAMSFAAAVQAAGLSDTFNQVHQQLQDQQVAALQAKDPRRANIMAAYDGFSKLNPEAFQTAAQSIISSQPALPPAPGKSFEQQLQDAAKAARGATPGASMGAMPAAPARNPFMLPKLSDEDVGLVNDLVPHAQHLAMPPGQVLSMAKAAADKRVGQLTDKLNDLGATIGPDGKITVNPQAVTETYVPTGGWGYGAGIIRGTRDLSPDEMLSNSNAAVKLRDQLSDATQQQARMAQILSMANAAAPQPAPAAQSILANQQLP